MKMALRATIFHIAMPPCTASILKARINSPARRTQQEQSKLQILDYYKCNSRLSKCTLKIVISSTINLLYIWIQEKEKSTIISFANSHTQERGTDVDSEA